MQLGLWFDPLVYTGKNTSSENWFKCLYFGNT